jgi:glycosyltransferase involved in cell wall biosynthesis
LECCDDYWTVSKYLAIKAYNYGYADKTRVLYNGIQLDDYKYASEEIKEKYRKKYGLENSDKLIIYAGRIVPEKGALQLIKAFKKAQFSSSVKLIIAGGSFYSSDKVTPYMKECLDASKNLGNIIFAGYVPGNEITALYHLGCVGVVPSIWNEPFGLTVLEMMASGLPIITTNRGAITELVDDSMAFISDTSDEENWILSMAEQMKKLVEDEGMARKMGHQAQIKADEFSVDKYLMRFSELLE